MPDENDMPNEKNMLLIEAYRIQVERWNKRRDIEWRLTLTLWSTILITTFALAGKIQPPGYIVIIHVALFFVYWHWIRCLWIRNAEDKDWMFKYQKIINTKLCVHGKLDRGRCPNNPITWRNNYFKVWKDWAMRSQLLLTAVILVFSFLILYFTPKSDPPVLSIPKTLLDKLMELIEQYIR